MGKGKQPYIPLYIGDWEQDTNCLSLEAEGAWLKIVFKCWKNKGIFMTNADSVCNLWKVSREKFASILLELKTNQICDLEEREDGSILFISRRLVREAEISGKKAVSGSIGGSKTQANKAAKSKQNPEYDIDNDSDIEIIEIGVPSKISIGIKSKYAGEPVRRIYDLAEYFRTTGQLEQVSNAGWTERFGPFMNKNPGKLFDDDGHLYNAINRFEPSTTPKLTKDQILEQLRK